MRRAIHHVFSQRPRFRTLLVSVALVFTFTASASAATTTITVQAGASDGAASAAACSAGAASGTYACPTARDAVALANQLGGDPTVQLGAGTFSVTDGPLEPTVPMTISGVGDQGSSVTTVTPSGVGVSDNLTLADLVLNGAGTGCGELSGDSKADVVLDHVTITEAKCDPVSAGTVGQVGSDGLGAAFDNVESVLTLHDSVVSDNVDVGSGGGPASGSTAAGTGGQAEAVIVTGGLVMSGSVVTDNTATGGVGGTGMGSEGGGQGGTVDGAGIEVTGVAGTPTLSITASEISDNTATGGGGGTSTGASGGGSAGAALGAGLFLDQSPSTTPATISDSTFIGNVAQTGQAASNTSTGGSGGNGNYAGGGGLFASGSFPLQISDSTFTANQSIDQNAGHGPGTQTGYGGQAEGGGLYVNEGPTVTVVNSTIAGNTAQSGTGAASGGNGSFGGGIDAYGVTGIGLDNDTISGNSVAAALGASVEFGANLLAIGSPITLAGTAVANPLPAGASNCATQSGGVFKDGGYNLEDTSPSTCGLSTADHDQVGPSGLPADLSANGAPGPVAAATDPTIPAPETLAPAAGSLLIGNGGACVNPLAMGSPPLGADERGDTRPATCDIGAFQTEPVTVTGAPVITGTHAVGQTLTCASGSFASAGDGAMNASGAIGAPTITYMWTRGTTALSSSPTYTVGAADQGAAITCTETATGAYGHGSATSGAVSIPAAPTTAPSTTAPAPSTGTRGKTNLILTRLHETHVTWSERKLKHGPPHGTVFTYSLNVAATVQLSFTRVVTGRTVNGRCVALSGRNRHKRHCTLSTRAGTLVRVSRSGVSTVSFTGRLGRKILAPGTYTLTVTARTMTGATIAPQKLRFTIRSRDA